MAHVLRKAATPLVALLLAATLFVAYTANNPANATHMPADKVAASGETIRSIAVNGSEVLLRERMKVATPTDLIISFTAECSILTNVANHGDGVSEARGNVDVQVLIDGQPVPVRDSSWGTPQGDDPCNVTLCNRLHRQTTMNFDDDSEDDEIEQYQETKQANGFNWISINPAQYDANSDNILDIEVVGTFTTNAIADPDATTPAFAEAFVGNRTLVIEPVKLSVHEDTSPDGED